VAFHQLPLLDPLDDEPSPPRDTDELDEFDEPDTVFPDEVVTFVESRGTVVVPPETGWPTDPLPP
jgi:hypothetical protein